FVLATKRMRLATFQTDYWQLRDAEECHAKNPDEFWIPPLEERINLQRGQSAKLIFDIEATDEDGNVIVTGERMWVTVLERVGDLYVGILENQPASLYPDSDAYLTMGAEIPFGVNHVTDIANPPVEFVKWQLSQPPDRNWPRE
ncbi:MAG: hypothetical protein ACK55N_05830, partial [Planctomycetota bacterium]